MNVILVVAMYICKGIDCENFSTNVFYGYKIVCVCVLASKKKKARNIGGTRKAPNFYYTFYTKYTDYVRPHTHSVSTLKFRLG